MLSIRSFARAAPRACSRITSTAIFRPARSTSLLQSAFKPARTQFASAFSTSQFRRRAEGDEELIAKLESEIGMENEMKDDSGEIPTSVKDYLENGPFEVIDTPGNEEVILTRTFGDEK
jgi:complement component 1 Q subcomponent-binding protein